VNRASRVDLEAGYTLLEALAAVFIIALVSGIAVASMPDPADDRDAEVLAFAAKLERASDQAVTTGLFMGATIDADGYRFYRRFGAAWRETIDRDGFGAHIWSEGALVTVAVDGGRLDQARLSDLPNAAEGQPAVRFDPTGVATPAEIRITYPDVSYGVRIDIAGEAVVEQVDGV
jgi:general secretion pathway protein H